MGLYVRAKCQVSSLIWTSFRQGVILPSTPTPTSKQTPKNPAQIRVKNLTLKSVFLSINKKNIADTTNLKSGTIKISRE